MARETSENKLNGAEPRPLDAMVSENFLFIINYEADSIPDEIYKRINDVLE